MSTKGIVDISFEGGLDLTSNAIQLYQTPGAATELVNFESSEYGGYRRVDGFSKFGTAQPDGAASEIFGVSKYADGIIACQGSSIYFSTDGTTWIKVNKDLAAGGDLTALQAASELPRTSQKKCSFTVYESNNEYGIVTISDGVNLVGHFEITDSGGRKYYYKELDAATAAPAAPQHSVIYKDRLVLGKDVSTPNVLYWSKRYSMDDFTGASAGSVDIGEPITGIKAFRERLFVFGRGSIYVLDNIDGAPSLQPVTTNVGCLCGFSIQEIGGDLVFLAPDGIRTLSGTQKIGDIGLTIISSKITPIVQDIIRLIAGTGCTTTVVIRDKNQYRLFYPTAGGITSGQKGLIGTLRPSPTGEISWEWSETLGIEVTATSKELLQTEAEAIYHGGYSGYIYKHLDGNDFDGAFVDARFKSPNIHYGNTAMRKTLHAMTLTMQAEGATSLKLDISYDFGSNLVHNPPQYSLPTITPGALIGEMIIGEFTLGSVSLPAERVLVEGGGFSNSFKFSTKDTGTPYTLNGISVEFIHTDKIR